MTDRTGYKRPPVASRWKKGQSGNPSGRKKGSRNLATDLEAELQEMVVVTEGGKARKISKQRALFKSLVANAIKNDQKAMTNLLGLMGKLPGAGQQEEPTIDLTVEDKAIIANFLRRNAPAGGED